MLEAMGAVQVGRHDHLVVEAIDGVVQVHIVEPELNARNRQDVAEVAQCRADPPHRLVVTWQINGHWQYDPDPAHASEIEVRFSADGPDQTTVELEHRRLERLVDGQALRDGITGGGGWSSLLELFAKAATNHA
jgi:uncharacterized protein YndB with AHSA1/START domain